MTQVRQTVEEQQSMQPKFQATAKKHSLDAIETTVILNNRCLRRLHLFVVRRVIQNVFLSPFERFVRRMIMLEYCPIRSGQCSPCRITGSRQPQNWRCGIQACVAQPKIRVNIQREVPHLRPDQRLLTLTDESNYSDGIFATVFVDQFTIPFVHMQIFVQILEDDDTVTAFVQIREHRQTLSCHFGFVPAKNWIKKRMN